MLRVAQPVTLKVAELASGRLHDNSVVYVHPSKMDALSLFDGDVVRLEGTSGRVTVGIVVAMADAGVIRKAQCTDKADAVDEVQMNWAMRHNLGVFLHGYVTICRLQLDPPQATRVHIRVVADTLHPAVGQDLCTQWVLDYYRGAYRPAHRGDLVPIVVGCSGETISVHCQVVRLESEAGTPGLCEDCCILGPDTMVHVTTS